MTLLALLKPLCDTCLQNQNIDSEFIDIYSNNDINIWNQNTHKFIYSKFNLPVDNGGKRWIWKLKMPVDNGGRRWIWVGGDQSVFKWVSPL